ncbi:unnamed protein product [Prorocentrum cordatum]|uniref:Peptide chain release factor domain-containing protein n=1 Tax=Prorocentrum cordatum TaxID=2364126 RepID=A0ABN9SMT4_9DINO|nr:unnamed protein product [Polarella glacialis]
MPCRPRPGGRTLPGTRVPQGRAVVRGCRPPGHDAELASARARLERCSARLEEELLLLHRWAEGAGLLGGGEAQGSDGRGVVLEVAPGVGGAEAALFAGELFEMYERLAEERGWTFESEGNAGGSQGYTARISSAPGADEDGPFGWLRWEAGVHRVQRIPETEKKDRMQTSAATVVVLPMAEEAELSFAPGEVVMEVSKKSSGPGGQSVNASHQAIRAIHLPTGMSVRCVASQSQFENRKGALEMLRTRLLAKQQSAKHRETSSSRKEQRGTGDRSEKIRTYNFSRDDVIDHRLGKGGPAARESERPKWVRK